MTNSIAILSFSSRENGNCAHISEYISKYHQTTVNSFVINNDSVKPCGACNYECLTPGQNCPQAKDEYKAMMDAVCESSLVYFIVPNFCGYPCANYFAFNERTVGYFQLDRGKMKAYMDIPKRFIVVSNTEGFEAAMQQQTSSVPQILYLKSGKYKKRSTAGDILDCDEAIADLEQFLSNTGVNP